MSEPPALKSAPADRTLVPVLYFAAAEWVVLIFLGMLTLDGGRMSKVTNITAFGYAAGVAIFVARRGTRQPSLAQRAILLASPIPLVILAALIAGQLGR